MIKALEDFDANSLLVELLQRAKEGEIDLTEVLWEKMEPSEDQIMKLCEKEEFDEAVDDAAFTIFAGFANSEACRTYCICTFRN